MDLEQRLQAIERRLDNLDGAPKGYKCTGCGHTQPSNHYWYAAWNSETSERVTPLCAPCIRGGMARVMGAPWKHQGPFTQPVA